MNGHASKPCSGDEYIELRVAYPGRPYVALIHGLDGARNLNRLWIGDDMYRRRDHLEDGHQVQVYRLPTTVDGVYEIAETIGGRGGLRYVAVFNGILHRITRDAVEQIAEGSMTLRQWSRTDDDEYGDIL